MREFLKELQEDGELAPKCKNGVVMPWDEKHSGKTSSAECLNGETVDISYEVTPEMLKRATPEQIEAWEQYKETGEYGGLKRW